MMTKQNIIAKTIQRGAATMAKWVLDTFEGKKVWYSGDVIESIMSACIKNGIINHYDAKGNLIAQTGNPLAAKIMKIIESEDKC